MTIPVDNYQKILVPDKDITNAFINSLGDSVEAVDSTDLYLKAISLADRFNVFHHFTDCQFISVQS